MSPRTICQIMRQLVRREVEIYSRRPIFLFVMIVAPLACMLFFTTLMSAGLPQKLPAAIVDPDDTHITRIITRILDAFEETDIRYRYRSFQEAREAMQEGKIYGFFYLPPKTTHDAVSSRVPHISFYTNDSYYVPANLLMKDMKTGSELAALGILRETLYARGLNERRAMGILQPIVIETHPLHNASLDYSVYLSNMLVPGILILLIMLTTSYAVSSEWKRGTQRRWYMMAHENQALAVIGKLLPQTLLYWLLIVFMDIYFYRWLGFPLHCPLIHMILIGWLTVLAAQGFGVFLCEVVGGRMRLAMCLCSLWGILSFSLAGFTFPVTAMDKILQVCATLFPLRHYYLIYVNQALDGFSIGWVWSSVMALVIFCLLPVTLHHRLRKTILTSKYEE